MDEQAIRQAHRRDDKNFPVSVCSTCVVGWSTGLWPCEIIQALDALDAERKAREQDYFDSAELERFLDEAERRAEQAEARVAALERAHDQHCGCSLDSDPERSCWMVAWLRTEVIDAAAQPPAQEGGE